MPSEDRTARIARAFIEHRVAPRPLSLCLASAEVLAVSSAAVSVMSEHHSGPVCCSDQRAGTLDELQFSLGEGPSPDAFASDQPVSEPDLAHPSTIRWPSFAGPAIDLGTRAVFAFPLHAGQAPIGVLTLYEDSAGGLEPEQVADSLVVADLVAMSLLDFLSPSDPGAFPRQLLEAGAHRAEVHQASGMVAVQLGIGVAEAAVRLRAFAYATSRSIADVAADVVERRLRLGDDRRDPGES
jgi:hypothetical protein